MQKAAIKSEIRSSRVGVCVMFKDGEKTQAGKEILLHRPSSMVSTTLPSLIKVQ